ncbi:MAG: cytochrome c oxidase subunit II [Nitrococcus sp.]|nr:cytochrome c oxidase subunit II [Nitrococcus sp.]
MYQSLALTVTVLGIALIVVVFLYFASSAREAPGDGPSRAARWRNGIFWVMLLSFIPITVYSLTLVPFPASVPAGGNPLVVDVVGRQWSWSMSRNRFAAGRPIEFHVRASDVNHGFAIYGPEMQVITQTQAMPGYTNVLRHTFTAPGTYQILCLEYCGLIHHAMKTTFTVVAATGTQL